MPSTQANRTPPLRVLYEDNHLLAVSKPAGVPTQGAAPGVVSVLDLAREYVRVRYDKPGNVYLGVVSRLDAPVTGVLLFARTSKAASRLSAAFRERRVEKRYLAAVVGRVEAPTGPVVHHLRKDDARRRVYATRADDPEAQRAELSVDVLAADDTRSLLAVTPVTGRKHQIRAQLAKLGAPILGDTKYGGPERAGDAIALHAWRLVIDHPVRRVPLSLEDRPPTGWGGYSASQLAERLAV